MIRHIMQKHNFFVILIETFAYSSTTIHAIQKFGLFKHIGQIANHNTSRDF